MPVSDWLNSKVFGNTTLGDIAGTGIDFYDQYQRADGAKSSIDEQVKGFDKGINYTKTLGAESKDTLRDVYESNTGNLQPYQDAGKVSLDHYMGLTQDPSTITSDPAYQFRLEQGQEAVQRTLDQAGYADPGGSGANPAGITKWAQGYATDELDRALARDLPIIEGGRESNRTGILAGDSYSRGITGVNANMANNVSAMYRGRANALSTNDLIDSMAMSGYLKGAQGLLNGASGDPNFMDLLKSAVGGGVDEAGESLWGKLGEAFGFDPADNAVMNAVNGFLGTNAASSGAGAGASALTPGLEAGFDAFTGAALPAITGGVGASGFAGANGAGALVSAGTNASGALGMNAADFSAFGGDYSAALANAGGSNAVGAAAAQSFGSWAASVAGGMGALLALSAGVDFLRSRNGDSNWTKAMKDMEKNDDPLSYISKLNVGDLPKKLFVNDWTGELKDKEARGSLYGALLSDMEPGQMEALHYHNDIDNIVGDMLALAKTGKATGGKHSLGGDSTAALEKMFPEIAGDIRTMFDGKHRENTETRLDQTSADITTDYDALAYKPIYDQMKSSGIEAERTVSSYIKNQLSQWETEKITGEVDDWVFS